MKAHGKISGFIFLFISLMGANGQDVPWNYKITSSNHTIIVHSDVKIEILDYSGSGVLGVFYDSLGTDICAGYIELNGYEDYLIAYGEVANNDGISVGDSLIYKLWDREKDCIYENMVVDYDISDQSPNTGGFVNEGISSIRSIKASSISVEYPTGLICPGDSPIEPIFTNTPLIRKIIFSSSNGLWIDSNTGLIDGTQSLPGTYTINISSKYCISSPTHTIIISAYDSINIPEQQYKCPDELIDLNSLVTEATDSWTAIDTLNNIKALDIGEHTIYLKNRDGCIIDKKIEIINYPEQEVQFKTKYNCESTTIELINDGRLINPEWSNNSTGNSTEVYEDSNIQLQYTDSNQCDRATSLDITIKKIQVQSLNARVIPADCYQNGKIEIKNATIENSVGEIRYEFINQLTEESYHSIDRLSEGKYLVNVIDGRNCKYTWSQELIVIKDCLNDRPVFSPNNDYVDDKYYISEIGKAEVYNRYGSKVSEFETPIYWDGTNRQGQKLPMGTYLIVINNKKVINITILK